MNEIDLIALIKDLGTTGVLLLVLWRIETRWIPIWERLLETMIRIEKRLDYNGDDEQAPKAEARVPGASRRRRMLAQ